MATISLGPPLPTNSSDLPAPAHPDRVLSAPADQANANMRLLDLARGGACLARSVTRPAVCSYHTFSPLPPRPYISTVDSVYCEPTAEHVGRRSAVCFLWRFPAITRHQAIGWVLPTTVSYRVRTFLISHSMQHAAATLTPLFLYLNTILSALQQKQKIFIL